MNRTIRHWLSYSLLFKLLIALWVPLTLDEYYYYLWGHQLSLSYFDHPPMVGWLMYLAQPFVSYGEGAIRWPFILLSHGTLFLWIKILSRRLPDHKLKLFIAVCLLNPLWGWGAIISTPDIPLLFFWTLAIYALDGLIRTTEKKYEHLLVAALALGFVSKYQMVLFLPPLFFIFWKTNQLSRIFKLRTLGLVLEGLVLCSPVLIWNYHNDWASFLFQWKHGMAAKTWHWHYPLDYLLGQIMIIFPVFLIPFFRKPGTYAKDWMTTLAAFPVLFFLYSSFKGRVEANWVIMSLPVVYALGIQYAKPSLITWQKRTIYLWSVLLFVVLSLPLFKPQLPSQKIRLFESDRFSGLVEIVNEKKAVYAYNYQMASYLSFKTDSLVCKLPLYGRPDHFNFIKACNRYPDHFYYITKNWESPAIEKDFEGFQVLSEQAINQEYKLIEVGQR